MRKLNYPPETVAIHEAGHAVARIRLGLDLGGVSIERDRKAGTVGTCSFQHPDWLKSLPEDFVNDDYWRKHAIACLAGPAAEWRLLNVYNGIGQRIFPFSLSGAQADVAWAGVAVERCGWISLQDARRLATRMVRRDLVWEQIKQVAKALQVKKSLECWEVSKIYNDIKEGVCA